MTKRSNPFEFDYSPVQSKVKIGLKQVDAGVDHESRMRNVYEYTKQLLINGARSMKDKIYSNNDVQTNNLACEQKSGYKQLCLDSNLKLSHKSALQVPNSCSSYNTNKCYFCEKVISISGNTNKCHKCGENFCSLCSMQMYGQDDDENAICLSCSN